MNRGTISCDAVVRNHDGLVMAVGVDVGIYSDDFHIAEASFSVRLARKIGLCPFILSQILCWLLN